MTVEQPKLVPLAPLLEHNRAALDCIRHNEEGNLVSALWRYRRMQSKPPAIILAADGLTILDGLHRALVAEWCGQETIEAIG
jgi:hypothetical protein